MVRVAWHASPVSTSAGTGTAAWRERAGEAVPAEVAAYWAGGDPEERAAAGWQSVSLRPRVLVDVSRASAATTLLGHPLPAPLVLSPTALHCLAHPEGEVATAVGAARVGLPFTVATRASRSLADVAAAAGPWWLQVYVLRDRGLTQDLLARAVAGGAQALVLTGDTPLLGRRAGDRASLGLPPEAVRANVPAETTDESLRQATDLTPDVIGWLAELSGLPVLVKGVLRGDDARRCLDAGAAGVVVSHHGGRQLAAAVSPARVLAEVVQSVAGRGVVLADGGIRTGEDVLRALALGADAACLGRPVLWALAAGGADGVADLLGTLVEEIRLALALAGTPTVADVGPDLLALP